MYMLKINLIKIPYSAWLVLIGTFITSGTYWMTWPFLAVILNQNYHLSASYIGAIFSISTLFSTCIGIYFGNLSDKLGRSKMIIYACIISAVAFAFLAIASNITLCSLAIILISLSRALLDPLNKAIFSDMIDVIEDKTIALHLRYFVVNLGAGCGPLIGLYLGLAAQQGTFIVTAMSFLVYLFFLFPILNTKINNLNSTSFEKNDKKHDFLKMLQLLACDRAFMILVLINILLWIILVQFESTIALYFSILKISTLTKFLSILILTNTLTIILLQFPLLAILKNISITYRIYFSIAMLSISQLMFSFSSPENLPFWIISTIVFSIAEVILVPNLNIVIDKLAPKELRGCYFAASFLYRIGSGSYIGGILLQLTGGKGLFLSMFFICLIIAILYYFFLNSKKTGAVSM